MTQDTKACPLCAETIKAAAIKCRFCNADLTAYAKQVELQVEQPIFAGHPAVIYTVWQWIVVLATLGVAYGFYWLKSVSTRYEITSQRVRIEQGIFSKVKESVELFRIDHFDVLKPLGMRMAGQCVLHLRSSDAGFPSVRIYGVPELEKLGDQLRELSLQERTRRKVTTFVQA
jgi:membrane protein YdbS with pleckstrin-like domain